MSPSVRSMRLTRSASQSSGTRPQSCRKPWIAPSIEACSDWEMPRKSGIRHTSHRSFTPAGVVARRLTSRSSASALSATTSSASRARLSQSFSVRASSEAISASTEPKRRSELRHISRRSGAKRDSVMASTTSGSSGGASPVTPKVPGVVWRPARPAICASSFGIRCRIRRPSNLVVEEKATWRTSRLSPMPMASVATRKSTSPFWYIATWALRVRGLSAPMTTAAPPFWRRISSAMA